METLSTIFYNHQRHFANLTLVAPMEYDNCRDKVDLVTWSVVDNVAVVAVVAFVLVLVLVIIFIVEVVIVVVALIEMLHV
eukprot:gene3395-6049_t